MSKGMKTLHEVNEEGIRVLMKTLGPADALRFLRQYHPGSGNYTADRHKMLGRLTRAQILQELRATKPLAHRTAR